MSVMGWMDYLNQMRQAGDAPLSEDVLMELETELRTRDTEYDTFRSGAETRFANLQKQIADRQAEISNLKATNFDLLMSSGAGSGGDDAGSPKDDEKDESQPRITGIDSLF